MDAADWYLNLSLRGAIARGKSRFGRQYVRGPNPVIRRADESPPELDFISNESRGDFATILEGKEPRLGVESLRTEELYFFERRLPEAIRQFGRTHVPGNTPAGEVPNGFVGPVDHLFEPRFLSVFARIDLSLPDKTLLADLQSFLKRERGTLAAIGGKEPSAAALRDLSEHYRPNLNTFANYCVLSLLDIEQWWADEDVSVPIDAAFARLLGIEEDALPEARKKARLVLDDFALRGWLLDAARAAVRKPHP
jgi:hypothetical protein